MAGSSSSGGFFDGGNHHQIPMGNSSIPVVLRQHPSSGGADVLSNSTVLTGGGSMVGPTTSSVATAGASQPNPKKRRNVPGTTNHPDAEIIALSPKSLMATNRFICEVCNKGFQREQNLQLHRRGHNLPWKLKQKSTNKDGLPVRKKVYLCPEPSCVHHEPSRALGDLTGIKKHYYRKHGEKKFKCDKCSKRYAVQSDWKAHRKTCGTREYRCDCGTVFSRRDSFVTHRAFCDVITREALNHPNSLTTLTSIGGGGGGGVSMFAPSSATISATGAMGLGLSQQLHHHQHMQPSSSSLQMQQSLDHHHHVLLGNINDNTRSTSNFDHLMQSSAFHNLQHQQQQQQQQPMTAANMMSNVSTVGQMYNSSQNNGYDNLDHNQQQQGLHQMQQQSMQNVAEETDSSVGGNCNNSLFNIGFFSPNSGSGHMSSFHHHHHVLNAGNNGNEGDGGGSNLFTPGNILGGQMSSGFTSLFGNSGSIHHPNITGGEITTTPTPHMSATALLQKAAQIGSTSSNNSNNNNLNNNPFLKSVGFGNSTSPTTKPAATADTKSPSILPPLYDGSSLFDEGDHHHSTNNIQEFINTLNGSNAAAAAATSIRFGLGGSDRLTRDFLGVGEQPRQQQGIDFMMGGGRVPNNATERNPNNVNNNTSIHNNAHNFGGGQQQ